MSYKQQKSTTQYTVESITYDSLNALPIDWALVMFPCVGKYDHCPDLPNTIQDQTLWRKWTVDMRYAFLSNQAIQSGCYLRENGLRNLLLEGKKWFIEEYENGTTFQALIIPPSCLVTADGICMSDTCQADPHDLSLVHVIHWIQYDWLVPRNLTHLLQRNN